MMADRLFWLCPAMGARWGFWGATVITNLFSAISGCGEESIVTWLWAGFSVR